MQDDRIKVLKILEDKKEETIKLTRELLMISSQSKEEKAVAELINKRLLGFGFQDTVVDDLFNVICKIRGNGNGPTLLYNGHIDVVPLGNLALWPIGPLEAPIVDGKIFGRGACDMKGSVAAMMTAANAIKLAGIQLKGSLILTMVGREEEAQQEGTRFAIEKQGLKADIGLIGEATNLNISLGSRGRIIVEIKVKGKSAHAANASKGINAVVKSKIMIDALATMKLPSHDILGQTTQTITKITSEPDQSNMVPSLCTITIDRRISPDENPKKIEAEFRKLISQLKVNDPEFDAEVETSRYAVPGYLPPEKTLIEKLRKSAEFATGKKPKISTYIFGTDGTYLSSVMGIPWFGFGPGDEANAHTVNDNVSIDDLIAASKIYAMFILELIS